MNKVNLVLFLVWLCSPSAYSAKSNFNSVYEKRARAFLNKSKTAFKNENLSNSKVYILRLLRKYPASDTKEEALVILANIHLMNSHWDSAQTVIDKFTKDLPGSDYSPRMNFYQGLIYLNRQQKYDAAQMFINAINSSTSPDIYNKSKHQLNKLISRKKFNEEELQNLIQDLKYDRDLLSKLLLLLGDIQLAKHRFKAAQITFDMWLHYFPSKTNHSQVKQKLREAKKGKVRFKTILIMLPLSGFDKDVGKSLLQGILLVLDKRLARGNAIFKYKIIDTKGDPILSVNRLRRALQEDDVIAVLGPVMSDVSTSVAVALSSNAPQIAMITPTATTKGISALGQGIFQINVTTHALGSKISRYAVECLNLKEFAILAPNTEYGIDMATTFEKDVSKRGGNIIATEYYDPDAKDFSGNIQVIKRRMAQAEVEKKWPLYKIKNKHNFDKTVLSFTSDSVLHLDGVFIAATNGDESLRLSAQVSYNKIITQFLGSSGWYDNNIFLRRAHSARGAIFSVGYYQDKKSKSWITFKEEYRSKWQNEPTIISALGYNAAVFLLNGVEDIKDNSIVSSLTKIKSFQGLFGNIEMDNIEGYNKSAVLLKVGRRKFIKLGSCPDKRNPR